ncbi:MAG: hypothetical protein RDV48_30865 [Candidatus Eremiobacteraeota bacterium]|nr:hypothetical protein [Candidatus Eremiobacteraeota bacterium]
MADWRRIREQHLSDAEVFEEYAKLPPVYHVAQIIGTRKCKGSGIMTSTNSWTLKTAAWKNKQW